ncbi:MAG: carbohydrate ABC transporter permease [Ruminiclostridium sp.]|nr:carbohydrate ABC transporter permease [Ruminiclostridium sp.]
MTTKRSLAEKVFDITNIFFMIFFTISILLPFWLQIVTSTSAVSGDRLAGFRLFPSHFTMNAYKLVLSNALLLQAYVNTIFRTVAGTLLQIIVTAAFAYSLSKKYLWKRNFWTVVILIPLYFSGGLIPTFLLIKGLGLYDNLLVYILPGIFASMNAVFIRNYMMSLPQEMEESARVDGANEITIFARLIMPLSMPILATVALWTGVGHWNSWFDSMIYTNKPENSTLAYLLYRILYQEAQAYNGVSRDAMRALESQTVKIVPESLQAATLMVTILPIIFLYPFLQRYFVKGIVVGSLKG